MGQTGNRGSQEAIGSDQDESKVNTTPSTTLTSRIFNLVNELRFSLPLRPSRDTSPNPEPNRTPRVLTPMRFVSSADFRSPEGASGPCSLVDSDAPQRASTLPSSIRPRLDSSPPLAKQSEDKEPAEFLEMSTLRPKCTCWSHRTVCLVGELKRFRQQSEEDSPSKAEDHRACGCGEVCPVHAKSAGAAVLVDNIELDSGRVSLDACAVEPPVVSDADLDFYCNAETLPVQAVECLVGPSEAKDESPPEDEDLRPEEGYLRIILNLEQPINVVAGTRPPSIFDVIKHKKRATAGLDADSMDNRALTSFYMPRGTVKIIHIAKDTTSQDVIAALLRRFRVVDSPMKFALYERQLEEGIESTRVKMRRMADDELPLSLGREKQILLQENDHQDVEWDAFTVPELSNFLVILNREEDEYRRRVRLRYRAHQKKVLDRMEFLRPGSTAERYDYVLDDLKSATSASES